jgi:sortase A
MRVLRARIAFSLAILACGAWLLGDQAWLAAKAQVAERLIDGAFEAHLLDGAVHRPWRWADTHPIARLEVPRLGIRRHVLSGATGSSLAFGPGHVDGTAPPNTGGNCVLAGHRDSWFAFLEKLREGDRVLLLSHGIRRRYEVTETRVVSMWDAGVLEEDGDARLTLITCYPFGGILPSPWRYAVRCEHRPDRMLISASRRPAEQLAALEENHR